LAHRGWHITGIAYDGQRWDASSSTILLKSQMPSSIIELLEYHVSRNRLGLEELAVFAATVEDLVHSEAFELLSMAYEAHNLSMHEALESEVQENLVIRTFMLFYTMPWSQNARNNITALHEQIETAPDDNPDWNITMLWVEDLKGAIKYQGRAEDNPFSKRSAYFGTYPLMSHLVEQVIDGFGMFQDVQCRELKNMMLALEGWERNDGRVLLTNFYSPYLQGIHEYFLERPAYLRSLGSLDETDPKRLSVIVPNFLYGRSFCIATDAGIQSFCCVDQCNALMEALERSIAHPVASPGLIAELVEALPSDTVAAPRNLSRSLRWKLDTIAEQHDGYVPLHGRLFEQWMHHAFPNECSQPRAVGDTEAPMTHDEWRDRRNISTQVTKKVMQQLTDLESQAVGPACHDEACMSWTHEEELVSDIDLSVFGRSMADWPRVQGRRLRRVLRSLAMCGAGAALMAILFDSIPRLLWPRVAKRVASCMA